jgi:type IV secretory pathway VirB10-like protein
MAESRMRTFRIVFLLLIGLGLPLVSTAQSLGNVAKKERERRDKNKKEGVAAREITEEEVSTETEEAPAPEAESGEETGPSESGDEAVIPDVKPTAPEGADPDKESRERKRSEAEWRSKASTARARIDKAKERVRFFEELFLGPSERYVDAHGNTVIDSLETLRRLTKEAKDELTAAEADWRRMQDEARRAGIPPGWLR